MKVNYIIATKKELEEYPLVKELMIDNIWNSVSYYAGTKDCIPKIVKVQRLSKSSYYAICMGKESISYLIELAEEGDYEHMNQLYRIDNLFQEIKHRKHSTVFDQITVDLLIDFTSTLRMFDIIDEDYLFSDSSELHLVTDLVGLTEDSSSLITVVTVILKEDDIRTRIMYILETVASENGYRTILDHISIDKKEVTDYMEITNLISKIRSILIDEN